MKQLDFEHSDDISCDICKEPAVVTLIIRSTDTQASDELSMDYCKKCLSTKLIQDAFASIKLPCTIEDMQDDIDARYEGTEDSE